MAFSYGIIKAQTLSNQARSQLYEKKNLMSLFYQSIANTPELNSAFKDLKRVFKHGQSCAKCGDKLAKPLMTVDHIKDVEDPSVDPFDMTNWQVLCMPCHRQKNREKMKLNKPAAIERSERKA